MPELYEIKDERTVFCKAAMKANGGEWNPLTTAWMFRDASDHANALADLYQATRPTPAMISSALPSICAFFTPAGLPTGRVSANAFVTNKLAARMAAPKIRI